MKQITVTIATTQIQDAIKTLEVFVQSFRGVHISFGKRYQREAINEANSLLIEFQKTGQEPSMDVMADLFRKIWFNFSIDGWSREQRRALAEIFNYIR